ncbi:hypothetical protein [Delftia tsuruhatensis]|uniref:hypothetical protein n=1 Tax=Delftia tsuruhatensis TaxID=180282 RepID=UPI0032B28789
MATTARPGHEPHPLGNVVVLVEGRAVIGITPKLLAAAVLALLVSLLGNVLLTRAYLGQRDAAAVARASVGEMTQQRDGARQAAQACSDATEALGAVAAQRAAEAAPARAAAAGQSAALNARADYTLSRQPAAGDRCASLQALGRDWLKGRAKR